MGWEISTGLLQFAMEINSCGSRNNKYMGESLATVEVSGGSRGDSMGSMEPLFWRAAFENIMRKRTHTGAMHFSFTVAITHDLNSIIYCIEARMTYVHVPEAHGNHRDNERSERAN